MKQKWEEYQEDHLDTANIVQQGLNKLADYQNRVDDVLAYVLAMGIFTSIFISVLLAYIRNTKFHQLSIHQLNFTGMKISDCMSSQV